VILFTGFPGFIGARLLPRYLLRAPEVRVECLVQEKFQGRAQAALRSLEAENPQLAGRIALVTGDIAAPDLGIETGRARELRRSLRTVFHLAAVYDLAVPREMATRVNVVGTRNVLEFAAAAPRFERLHYVSTAYVSGTARGSFRETDLDLGQGFKNHYEESKFLAELEVVRSRLPSNIYRPGVVVGDSRTGETDKFDGPYHVLRLMERLPSPGVFFRVGRGRGTVNIVPVDFVIDALTALATDPASAGRTYHLCDPDPRSPRELIGLFARALGRHLLVLPVPMAAAKAVFAVRPVERLFGMPRPALDYFDDPVRHDTTQASAALGALGIACPRIEDYVSRLIGFYRAHRDSVRGQAMA
jgi:thioester reductase-like protein